MDLETKVSDLTLGQLIEALPTLKRQRIDGVRGLAAYVGVSIPKAQDLKNKQVVTAYEAGKRVYFYSDEVDNALRVKPIKRR